MLRAFLRWFALVPVGALIALLAACGGDDFGDDDDGAAAPVPGAVVDQDGDDSAATGAPVAGGVGGPVGEAPADAASQDFGRKIIRTANISLAIEDLDVALSAVRAVAGDTGGFVATSDIVIDRSEDEQVSTPQRATMTLRVPTASFEDAMDRLRDVAKGVDSETIGTDEVTSEYTDLQSRLRNLEAAERQYVALLERAVTIDEILRVQGSIDGVRGQIEQAQGRINVLDAQVELATITVNLRLITAPPIVDPPNNTNWAVQAWETSRDVSLDIAVVLGTVAIAGGVFSLWVIPLLVIALVFWKRFGGAISSVAKKIS